MAPENTMESFVEAKNLGADGIELDVHLTTDGTPVVLHDFDLSRTTNGSGVIFETPFSVVDTLDAGSWFGPAFAGEGVPRLAEVLDLGGLDFEIEIKGFGAGVVDVVLAAVADAGVLERVKFTGWNVSLLAALKQREPNARIGQFSQQLQPWMTASMFEHVVVGMAEYSVADVVHVHAGSITEAIVERLHNLGRMVQANDAASPAEVVHAQSIGADFVSADDVEAAVAAWS